VTAVLQFATHRLAQAFIALGQGLALESIIDPDAGDPALFATSSPSSMRASSNDL